jgi:ketosteroid isomerase-like protein
MSSSNKQIVEKVNAAFAQGNVEGFLSQCADDVEWTMVGEKPIKGKDAIRKWMTSMGPEVPKFTVTNLLADGDFATCYGDMTMRDKDGKVIPYSYCDIYRFRNGKVAELRAFVMKNEPQHAMA